MRIFISQPMSGKDANDIIEERKWAIKTAKEKYGRDIEIIDSYIDDEYRTSFEKDFGKIINNFSVYWLGMAIGYLSEADALVMVGDWENSKGCKIEKMVAETYGIEIDYL